MSDNDEWLIDDILPAEEFHIIAGPSGAGKTRWMAQALMLWEKRHPIHGRASHPVPWAYICADRGYRDMERTLKGVGADLVTFPYYSLLDSDANINGVDGLVNHLLSNDPTLKLLIIDGLAMMAPKGFRNIDSGHVAEFALSVSRLCHKKNVTIVGIMHSPKMMEGKRYENPRQRVAGSVAWAAVANTIILVEPFSDTDNAQSHRRVLSLLPRNGPPEFHDLQFNEHGRLVDVPPDPGETSENKMTQLLMDTWLGQLPEGVELDMEQLMDATTEKGISRRSMYRWLDSAVERGKLLKVSRGRYLKPFKT